ncbi:MAG: hypothetical protein EOO24_02520 [Comamonadaceae bacterium]|nr:MAG: hypothetical protein EOO24_02520 [Comamonadaceae bacterium]
MSDSRARCIKLARIIGVALLAFALVACSAVRLAYNNLPEVAYWWFDGYLDFDADQGPQVKEELARLLVWHRRTELPRIAALLQKAQALAPQEIEPGQVCALAEDIRLRLLAVAERAEAPLAEIVTRLGDAQTAQLERKYDKVNNAFRKEWLDRTPAERIRLRADKFIDRIEDFYGRLDAAQRELVLRQTEASVWSARTVDIERRARQQEVLTMLRGFSVRQAPAAEVRVAIHGYVQRLSDPPAGAFRDQQLAVLQEGCRHLAQLHATTTPAQRAKAAARLQAYEADVKALATAG